MTERKTIYLNDALEAIRKLPNAGIHWFVSAEAVFDALLKLPSAQPEIVRCKDCGHFDEELEFCDVFEWCNDGSEFYNRAEQKNVKVDFNK